MKYTDAQIIAALKKGKGAIKQAAEILGCSRWVITSRAKSSETIRNLLTQPGSGIIGRKQFTDEDILRAIEASDGRLSIAADKLGCSRRTIEMRAVESEAIRDAVHAQRERMLDEAESQLAKAVKAGKAWAITFMLSTVGKTRGYTRQQFIDMHQHIIVDVPDSFKWIEPSGNQETTDIGTRTKVPQLGEQSR